MFRRLVNLNQFFTSIRFFFSRQLFTKAISLVIVLSLLANTTPAVPQVIYASSLEFGQDLRFTYLTSPTIAALSEFSFWDNPVVAFFLKGKKKQERIARIEVSPNRPTIREGEKIAFAAIASDGQGNVIQGVQFNWTAIDVEKKSPLIELKNGELEAPFADQFVVTAEAGGVLGQTLMVVQKDSDLLAAKELNRIQTDETNGIKTERALRKDVAEVLSKPIPAPVNVSTRDLLDEKTIRERQEKIRNENAIPSTPPRTNDEDEVSQTESLGNSEFIKTKSSGPAAEAGAADETTSNNSVTAPVMQSGGCSAVNYNATGSWNSSNYMTVDDPGLQTGNPANTGTDGAGSGNFSFSAPILGFGERGDSDIGLALTYNSLLWHQANGQITYDIDKDYPAPGWSIGLGKLMDTGGSSGPILVSADGTRHATTGTIVTMTSTTSYYYGHTTDGSFVDYYSYRNTTSGITSGQSWTANGIVTEYGAASDGVAYPIKITDRHGNQTTITYCNNVGPNINTITDNLGRVIQFNYDSLGRLINITGPGQNGTTRTFVRIHYKSLTLTGTFSGLSPQVRNGTPYVIDAIYYPVTNTGYWFGDNDSYSSYGMITKVVEQRGMSSTGTITDQGTVTPGTLERQMIYNYPLAPSNLTKAPEYTQMIEDWANRESTTPVATTSYSINNNSSPRTTIITLPNGNQIKQSSYNNPGQWNDGLLYQVETIAPTTQILAKSVTAWEPGAYDSVRVTEIQSTDEKNQTTKQSFTYDTYYNQVATASEYGYGSGTSFPLLRKRVMTYENSTDYRGNFNNGTYPSGRHIFSLVKNEELFDANNLRLSQNSYTYDGATLVATPNVPMFDPKNDPYTTQMYNTGVCLQWNYPPYGSPYCSQWQILPVFQSATLKRGNVTNVTTYSDAANLGGAIPYDSTYDITGNVRTTTTDCCQQMQFGYSTATQYSQPDWHKKGSASDPNLQNIESATYDFNTGLQTSSTDFNGRTSWFYYDAVGRVYATVLPTGGSQYTYYNDDGNFVQVRSFDPAYIGQSHTINWYNGRGQLRASSYYGKVTGNYWDGQNWNQTETQYDEMGRKKKTSVVHTANVGASYWTEYFYDNLSRVTQMTAPDGSISQTFYNESQRPSSALPNAAGQTVRSRDAWGRERWARTDAFVRLVEVVEPDPNGNGDVMAAGNLKTEYVYNTRDELIQVNQGDQIRKFAYDSLGRLVRQKLAEQAASIEGQWSDAFVYDNRSNLVQRTDARGVKTNFVYNNDPLNRLQQVNYDKSQADPTFPIHDAQPVSLQYMTSGDKTRVAVAETTNVSYEENSYDIEGRISEYKIRTVTGTANTLVTSYLYDSLSRLTEVRYPAQFGMAGSPRKVVTPSYDETSRLKELKVDNQIQMSEIVYNPLSQVTQLKTGAATNNADLEQYTYDGQTGLLTNQKVIKQNSNTTLLDLSYNYNRGLSNGSINGKTGQLTQVIDNLNRNKDRVYEFDTLGRLRTAKGGGATGVSGVTANWTQNYSYDRYGNRTNVAASGVTQNNSAVPTDGLPTQTYQAQSNRITTANYQYDLAGNLVKGQAPDGTWQRYEYDAAGRLKYVKKDSDSWIQQANEYGSSRQRVYSWSYASVDITFYAWGGSSVIAEYTAPSNNLAAVTWQKSYIYAGSRLLSTFSKNGAAETLEFHHPDRLGTRLVTNNTANTSFEQNTLPFGTALDAESTGATNQRFTSYDRSQVASLDYAVNRSYASGQGRFTSVDPIGTASSSIVAPQSLNLYSYTENNPIDFIDPSGLFMIDLSGGGPSECRYVEIIGYSEGRPYVADRGWICTKAGSGGGGGGPDPGRGGGGGSAEKKPCNITVRAGGNLSKENKGKLTNSDDINSRKLGPNTEGYNLVGWFTAVEIAATVQGKASNWSFGQMAVSTLSVSGKTGSGGNFAAIASGPKTTWDDNPSNDNRKNVGNKIFVNDQPGINRRVGDNEVTDGSTRQKFVSFVTDGKNGCTVSWETYIEVKNGKIVNSGFSITGYSNSMSLIRGIQARQ